MDYRKMTCVQLAEESDRGSPSPPTSEQFDAIMAELARRDAMLAAAEKVVEALEQLRTAIRDTDSTYMHESWNEDAHIEDVTVVVREARMAEAALSAYRAAEGGGA